MNDVALSILVVSGAALLTGLFCGALALVFTCLVPKLSGVVGGNPLLSNVRLPQALICALVVLAGFIAPPVVVFCSWGWGFSAGMLALGIYLAGIIFVSVVFNRPHCVLLVGLSTVTAFLLFWGTVGEIPRHEFGWILGWSIGLLLILPPGLTAVIRGMIRTFLDEERKG